VAISRAPSRVPETTSTSCDGQFLGTFSDAVTVILGSSSPPPAGGQITITAPASGSTFTRGSSVTFSWTALSGVTRYGFEFTGTNRQFANPNGTAPDAVNGFGGAGGGFAVAGTSLQGALPLTIQPGSYQVRLTVWRRTGSSSASSATW
jgi:hypothetical protein